MATELKIVWRVEPKPTGPYASFQGRGWPRALYPDGQLAGWIVEATDRDYSAVLSKSNDLRLSVHAYDYSEGVQKRRRVKIKKEFNNLAGAKAALYEFLSSRPTYWPGVVEAHNKNEELRAQGLEPGAASLRVELKNGGITVYHGESGEALAKIEKAKAGSWARVWAVFDELGALRVASIEGVKQR